MKPRYLATLLIWQLLFSGLEAQEPETFFAVHCEPQTPHLFPKLVQLVEKANRYDIPLTILFAPQWVESILADSNKVRRVRTWQSQGHEIGAHHHGVYHLNWDGFTNYPTSTILSVGKSLNDYRGDMNAYRAVVGDISGDSLLLTLSGPGLTDPDSSVDWQPDFWYRTGGGREPSLGFSVPRVVGMGDYTACQVDHYFFEGRNSVDALIAEYNAREDKQVVGATTHVFNFRDDTSFVRIWFEFVKNTRKKTVRQIMLDWGCQPLATSVRNDLPTVPQALRLAQNYPNPFNPTTTIHYTVPVSPHGIPFVELKIYNLRGQVVRTLVRAFQGAGAYAVTWDGRDDRGQPVTSGVYLYRLKAGNEVQVRRMVLLK